MNLQRTTTSALCAALAALALACGGDPSNPGDDPGDDPAEADAGPTGGEPDAAPEKTEWEQLLDERQVDYNAALRAAALRLTGELPTLAEIKFVADAADQRAAYEALIESYMDDPRFARQMVAFWKDAFKMGGTAELDSAPVFAAQLVIEDRPYTQLFTARSGTCPTFDAETATFAAADCDNGVPAHAGVLSHPGAMAHYSSNMAFRRVRWVQETFVCTAFPAEVTTPQDVGGASLYTAPWPFDSIAGYDSGGAIDFLDTSAVTCANCHATMNHVAPIFGKFDEDGMWADEIQVTNPTDGLPITKMTDWLPEGEQMAWRMGEVVTDLATLGLAVAADPEVHECAVARMWNWAFGKGDIVDTLSVVPSEVIESQIADFRAGGFLLRPIIFDIFTSDDFVKF